HHLPPPPPQYGRRDHRRRHPRDRQRHPRRGGPVVPRLRHPDPRHLPGSAHPECADGRLHPTLAVLHSRVLRHHHRAHHQLHRRRPPGRTGPEAANGSPLTVVTDPWPDTDQLLTVEDLTVEFPTDDGIVQAARGVSYELRRGEVLAIGGESGSGRWVSSLPAMGLLPKTARISGSA